ncbi:12613_t:CDS:2 [Ambispora leptoticha]|uniref:Inositol-pentakisphosphate 2-kinase n=1 Tax=Ambispora leptoticha TaxID=144679 RepID=A0A9N9FLR3_9GLOM|nr:12613_t:CDS:2 [Ambispora leptoticha]
MGTPIINSDSVPSELYQTSAWKYKGEGNANIILTYIGELDDFKSTVIRLRKSEEKEKEDSLKINNQTDSGVSSNKEDEHQDDSMQTSSVNPQAFTVSYIQGVIAPLIGAEYTSESKLLQITPAFLQALSRSIFSHRTPDRVHKNIDFTQRYAILSPDYTKFRSNNKQQESPINAISIEIKPKWAFIPTSTNIAASNLVKRETCRYCMHQYYKHKKTQKHIIIDKQRTTIVTDYCPLDLFSLKKDRLRRAIGALISTPMNNFKLFVDGSSVDLAKITENLITLLTATILKEHNLFSRLKHLQKTLDELDIEGIMKLLSSQTSSSSSYTRLFVAEPSLEEWRTAALRYLERTERRTDGGTLQSSNSYDNSGSSIEKQPIDEAEIKQRILEFLLSTTFKDCSIIFTFQKTSLAELSTNNDNDITFFPEQVKYISIPFSPNIKKHNSGNNSNQEHHQYYKYKTVILDLDPKSILKLDYYYDLDVKIVRNFLEYAEKELGVEDDDNGEPNNNSHVFLGANKRKCFE